MKRLTREFKGVPAGEIYPVTYPAGAVCPPELLAAATALGAIEPEAEAKPAKPATKRAKG